MAQKGVRCYLSSAHSSLTTGTWTDIDWSGENFDNGGFHTSGDSEVYAPSGSTGIYSMVACITFDQNSTGGRIVQIMKNGSTTLAQRRLPNDGSTNKVGVVVTNHETLTGGTDYVEVRAYQDSGISLGLYENRAFCYFCMAYIGDSE